MCLSLLQGCHGKPAGTGLPLLGRGYECHLMAVALQRAAGEEAAGWPCSRLPISTDRARSCGQSLASVFSCWPTVPAVLLLVMTMYGDRCMCREFSVIDTHHFMVLNSDCGPCLRSVILHTLGVHLVRGSFF